MRFADASRGRPFSKDPHVIDFGGRYLMYTSLPPPLDGSGGWGIAVAASDDLERWTPCGEIVATEPYEAKGFCAPCARVVGDEVHLMYQTYGDFANDAICHAISRDGLTFLRNPTNPIFRPTGPWTNGRAIDGELVLDGDRALLYWATRDPSGTVQMVGVATAPVSGGFRRESWTQAPGEAILRPKLAWEQDCIEAASVLRRGDTFWMFYAGAYNNAPQQIGLARSPDGLVWTRVGETPFLPVGAPGSWNASESGHPHVFVDRDGGTHLFFQGNADGGATWAIGRVPLVWTDSGPGLAE